MTVRQWTARAAAIAVVALTWLVHPYAHAVDFLDPQDAFKFSAAVVDGGRAIEARFSVADGSYLYRDRFAFTASDGVQLSAPKRMNRTILVPGVKARPRHASFALEPQVLPL